MDDSAFLVPVEVKYINDIIGHGLFTKSDIPKGKLLWAPVLVKQYLIEECKQILRSKSKIDSNIWLRQSFILMHDQNHLCVNETDVGRFMNHSSNPNTGAASSSEPSVSLREILAGEELTCDYSGLGSPIWYQDLCKEYDVIPTNEVGNNNNNSDNSTKLLKSFDYAHDLGFKSASSLSANREREAVDRAEKPLHQWEFQIHALLVLLSTKTPPLLSTDELRRGVESLEREVYESWGYYERWAASMTHILIERNVFTYEQIDHEIGALSNETEEIMFHVGDIVRIKDVNAKTRFRKPHLRTPGYVHGRVGKITRYVGSYKNPSLLAFRIETPVHVPLYIVEIPIETIKRTRYYHSDYSYDSNCDSIDHSVNEEKEVGKEEETRKTMSDAETEVIQLEVYQSWLEYATHNNQEKETESEKEKPAAESVKRRKIDVDDSHQDNDSHSHSHSHSANNCDDRSHSHHDVNHKHAHSHSHEESHDHSHSHSHSHDSREKVEATAIIREEEEEKGTNSNSNSNSNLKSDHPGQRLAEGLIRLLVRMDIVKMDAIQSTVEKLEGNTRAMLGADLVVSAWLDPAFKQRLLTDAPAAAKELNITTSNPNAPTNLIVFENTNSIHHTVVCTLCSCYPAAVLGLSPAWYKSRVYRSRMVSEPRALLSDSFGLVLPESIKIVVHDSTADCRYMILPQRPNGKEGRTYEELRALVTRDSMIGVSRLS